MKRFFFKLQMYNIKKESGMISHKMYFDSCLNNLNIFIENCMVANTIDQVGELSTNTYLCIFNTNNV